MAVSTKTRVKGENAKKMTPEIYFARKLASNEKKIRDRSLKKLQRWIAARSAVPEAFSEDELMKLWKGLFYCMWMSDKPLIQEDLAETIAALVHSIADRKLGLKFVNIALKTMARSWGGIDTWRMDKFLMFVRRIIRHSLEYMAKGNWDEEEVSIYSAMLSDTIINANKNMAALEVPVGLQTHVTMLFPEELAKAGGEEGLASSVILKMLEPFAKCLATSNDFRLKKEVFEHVFTYLIRQSDEALEYEDQQIEKKAIVAMSESYNKRKRGRRGKSKPSNHNQGDEAEEKENDEDQQTVEAKAADNEDENEDGDDIIGGNGDGEDDMEFEESNLDWGAKDPRAGGVDAVIPQMRPNYRELADYLFKISSEKSVRSKNRKALHDLVRKFRDLDNGIYPLALAPIEVGPGLTPKMMKAAAKSFAKDQLVMSELALEEKLDLRKAKKTSSATQGALDAVDVLMQNIPDKDFLRAEDQLNDENNFADVEDGEDESDDDGMDEEDEDEEEELSDEEEEEGDSEENDDEDDDDDDFDSEDIDEEEAEEIAKPVAKIKAKTAKLSTKAELIQKPKNSLAAFEVEDTWEDDVTSPTTMQQLKQKLKAGKRPKNSGWSESPLAGEVEIVIPNKKFKGSNQLQPAPTPVTPENSKKESSTNSRNRRVNFVLNKNTAQEPKDYQESIRKSPGVPHDPDRQPSGGGVLKKNDTSKASPVLRKPQRGSANGRLSRI